MTAETLHFKIGLAGTYWSKRPIYSISLNDKLYCDKKEIESNSEELFYVEFNAEATEGPCILKIRLENKDNGDTVENADKTAIVKDMLLNIRSVEIDEINLGNLLYNKSQFVGDDPNRPVLDKCQDLGWNGSWILPFESPFYIWLLENI